MQEQESNLEAVLHHGDSFQILKTLPDNFVHAIVTDPPAGISYKRMDWDSDKGGRKEWIKWLTQIMEECLRVLKPGGYALVWALPRTSHWTATALESAGFKICDVVIHIFGDGVPRGRALNDQGRRMGQWSTLKPGSEHWVLCKKPITETDLLNNVKKHGTGVLNIDDCRIPFLEEGKPSTQLNKHGRFPTNVVFSHSDGCLPNQCTSSCALTAVLTANTARYYKVFYCPKASSAERNKGL